MHHVKEFAANVHKIGFQEPETLLSINMSWHRIKTLLKLMLPNIKVSWYFPARLVCN